MRYVRLPFIYSYRPVNIKFAAFDAEDWMESRSPALQAEGNKGLANALASDVNKTLTKQRVRKPTPKATQITSENTQAPTDGAAGSDKPIIRKGRPGTGNKPLTRREAERLMRKFLGSRALGFGRAAGLVAAGGLGTLPLSRLLFGSGESKSEYPYYYYPPYASGYRW